MNYAELTAEIDTARNEEIADRGLGHAGVCVALLCLTGFFTFTANQENAPAAPRSLELSGDCPSTLNVEAGAGGQHNLLLPDGCELTQ